MRIVPLQDAVDDQIFGAKAANLGRMIREGMPVPEGFAVCGNKEDISFEDIEEMCDMLPADQVAVRSSAVGEDSKELSFAGVHESFLNVPNKARDVADAIIACHSSVASARAAAYRQAFAIEEVPQMSVVVQSMISPLLAGTFFTRHPLSDGMMLIEAVSGLGEQLVSGEVTPSSYVVGYASDIIVDGELTEAAIPHEVMPYLLNLGHRIEDFFGCPQDIEWVIDHDSQVWIVQARPIVL